MFNLFCEYTHLEYIGIHVIYKINQAPFMNQSLW